MILLVCAIVAAILAAIDVARSMPAPSLTSIGLLVLSLGIIVANRGAL